MQGGHRKQILNITHDCLIYDLVLRRDPDASSSLHVRTAELVEPPDVEPPDVELDAVKNKVDKEASSGAYKLEELTGAIQGIDRDVDSIKDVIGMGAEGIKVDRLLVTVSDQAFTIARLETQLGEEKAVLDKVKSEQVEDVKENVTAESGDGDVKDEAGDVDVNEEYWDGDIEMAHVSLPAASEDPTKKTTSSVDSTNKALIDRVARLEKDVDTLKRATCADTRSANYELVETTESLAKLDNAVIELKEVVAEQQAMTEKVSHSEYRFIIARYRQRQLLTFASTEKTLVTQNNTINQRFQEAIIAKVVEKLGISAKANRIGEIR
ncbi:hypothetical protein GE09DRAFT_1227427 [Coniochaeta sp. 2T2.1]|nr:hypothetical protein GE09DRAFT_1227427 [Coniochaeta sp. 2T2.1]